MGEGEGGRRDFACDGYDSEGDYTVAQKSHTCKLKMLLQIKNSGCKLKIVRAN